MTTITSTDARAAQGSIGLASRAVTSAVKNLVSGTKTDANVADLSVGTILATRVGTLRTAVSNAGQAKSLLETAKGALDVVLELLQKQKSLAVKSSDDSLSDNERGFLNQEFQALVSEIDRISTTANFNGKSLLDGSISGNAGTSTTTGLANEQYSLLEAKDITSTGTVASGSLQNSNATVLENYITFGEPSGDGNITISLDADRLDSATGGTAVVQTVTVAVLDADTAAQVSAKVVAAINSAVSGATDSSYENFAQFDFASNSTDGVMTIKAKEAGSFLNLMGISVYDGGFGVTATLGTTNTNIENITQSAEQLITQGAVTAGAEGIFKAVSANNIADKAINAVLTIGTPSTASGSANGVKQLSTTVISGILGSAGGSANQATMQIVGVGSGGGGADNNVSFGGATITVGSGADSTTNVDQAAITTITGQAAAIAVKLQALSDAGTIGTNDYASYDFIAVGDTITATLKYNGTLLGAGFASLEGAGTFDGTAANGATAGASGTRDSMTFGGQTVIFAENADYIAVTGAVANTTFIDTALFATQGAQVTKLTSVLNDLSIAAAGNLDEYTFTETVAGTTIQAVHTLFGATIAVADVLVEGVDTNNRISASPAATTGIAGVADVGSLTIKDGAGATIGTAIAFTQAANATATAYTAADIAATIVSAYNADRTSASRYFDLTDNLDGTINVVGLTAGTDLNDYTIAIDRQFATQYTATLSGEVLADATDTEFSNITLALQGTNKDIAPSDLTFDANLLGSATNLKGTFTLGTGNDGASDVNNNTAQFTVDVNGSTYTSNVIQLTGSAAATTVSNTIEAGTKITFQRASGPVDANGANTNNAFQLNVESDINLATVTNASTGQASLKTVVTALQTQLDSFSINQDRSFNLTQIGASSSDHRITSAVGTILEGLVGFDAIGTNRLAYNDGDIRLISDLYGDTGTQGDVTSFTVDRLTDTISTTVNGEVFTAYLNSGNAPTTGSVVAFGTDLDAGTNNGTYSSTTKIITLGSSTGETAKLNFFSESITDGRILQINLGNVAANTAQLNISTTEGENALEAALNAVFGVSANDSLSFQVGADTTDTIGVSIGSSKTTDIYLNSNNVAKTLSVATIAKAQEAGPIIDTAINKIISLISDIKAAITSFDSSIQNNQASIQNADAARSNLLDTDYSQESTRFAEARVKVDAGTAILTQLNSRIPNLLQLLQQ